MMATVTSVRKSCFDAFSERDRALSNAVFRIIGVLGRRIFARAVELRSILKESRKVDCLDVATRKDTMAMLHYLRGRRFVGTNSAAALKWLVAPGVKQHIHCPSRTSSTKAVQESVGDTSWVALVVGWLCDLFSVSTSHLEGSSIVFPMASYIYHDKAGKIGKTGKIGKVDKLMMRRSASELSRGPLLLWLLLLQPLPSTQSSHQPLSNESLQITNHVYQ